MRITNLEKVKKTIPDMVGAANIYKQIPISREDGTPNFSFRVFTIEPGGHTPFHSHPFEHLNYIIEGNGELVQKEGIYPIQKGDFVLILPDEIHQYRNPSSQAFVMICAVPKEYE
jgi:quercetin dioxygenase-like cupin family protein